MIRYATSPVPRIAGPALLLLAIVRPAGAETGRPYLKQPAHTPAALAGQVAGDRQLTARYAKHFHASAGSVGGALRDARVITLPPGRYTVWLTGRDGLRYPTVQERAEPSPAFLVALPFDRDPESWLEAGTGNPMQVFRPVEEVEVVIETPPARSEEVAAPREVLVPVAEATSRPPASDEAPDSSS